MLFLQVTTPILLAFPLLIRTRCDQHATWLVSFHEFGRANVSSWKDLATRVANKLRVPQRITMVKKKASNPMMRLPWNVVEGNTNRGHEDTEADGKGAVQKGWWVGIPISRIIGRSNAERLNQRMA